MGSGYVVGGGRGGNAEIEEPLSSYPSGALDAGFKAIADDSWDKKAFLSLIDRSERLQASDVVRQTLLEVLDAKGQVRVSQLERDLSYSRRHIQRSFSQSTGIGLKQFCRVVRFQNALQAINCQTGQPLSMLAAENGYCDQAHLFKEFREFALTSPREYQSMLTRARYQNRIIHS